MPRTFKPSILTANHLLNGDVIYLDQNHEWSRSFARAKVFRDEDDAQEALANFNASEAEVVDVYLAEVETDGDVHKPAHFREAFRAKGPSNYHHGKQELEDV